MRGLLAPFLAVTVVVASCGGSESSSSLSTPDTSPIPATTVATTEGEPPPTTGVQPTTSVSQVVVTDSSAPPSTEAPPASATPPPNTSVPPSYEPLPPAEVMTQYSTPLILGELPGGSKSMGVDINNSGMIVGASFVGTFERYAVWWPDSTSEPQRLDGYLDLRFDSQQSIGSRVNDAGQVLVNAQPQAFLVDPVSGSSIEVVPPFDEGFGVQNLNSFGHVVGYVNVEWPECGDDCEPNPITRGFVWDPTTGETTVIDPLDGAESSAANSINDLGQVVGTSDGRPFVWDPADGSITELDVPENEYLVSAQANDINNQGVVVGGAQYGDGALGPSMRALIWDAASGEVLDLSSVLAADSALGQMINDSGEVVIRMGQTGSDPWVLDLVSNTVSMVPDVTFGYGVSINDHGQAVGMSAERAALWNPIT